MEPNWGDEALLMINCDACGNLKELAEVCLDMAGCPHLPCLECLTVNTMAYDGDHSFGVKCPLPSCLNGFLPQQHPAGWLEEQVQRLNLEDERAQAPQEEENLPELPPSDAFFCPICMEDKPWSAAFLGTNLICEHKFCKDCIVGHVESKVDLNVFPISCPNPDCQTGKLEPEDCRGLIPDVIFDRWGASLCESSVVLSVRFYCPFPDCSALMMNEGDEQGRPLKMTQCMHCERVCCAQCHVPWHKGLTCEEYKREEADKKEKEEAAPLIELARSRRWQKCPICGMFVERTEGCLYILCRCGNGFCYRCGAPVDKTHHCRACNLTWDEEH